MVGLFNLLLQFLKPAIVFFVSVAGIVAFLIGALADPQGLMNQIICSAIDYIAALFPSTPDNLKIASMINSVGDSVPVVGRGVIREIFSTIATIFSLSLVIKIYKLIPFKAT